MLVTRLRTRLMVGALVLVVAGALFTLQLSHAQAACSLLPGSPPCGQLPWARIALDVVYVTLAALLAAGIIAMLSGVNWRHSTEPNSALARRLDEEETAFRTEQARRSELAQLNALARAHVAALTQAGAELAAAEAAEAADSDSSPRWQLEEESRAVETPEQARRRVLADRLKTLARNRPDTVAEVVQVWINQPRSNK